MGRHFERLAAPGWPQRGPTQDQKQRPGALKPQVSTGAPPGTRTPNPRIKSPQLTSSIPAAYQHLYANTLARYRQPPEAEYRLLTDPTAWYRDIRANMEQTRNRSGLDQCEGDRTRRREERFQRPGVLVQRWLQRWTRSVISPGSVARQEGARWTSGIPVVHLGRTRRAATPAAGPPRPQVPVLPLCRCTTVTGSAMTLQVRRRDKGFRNPGRERGVAH